jgi:hypothetical protein
VAAVGVVRGEAGRKAAAVATSRGSGERRRRVRRGSGAVTTSACSWLAAWMRALRADWRATRGARSIATAPDFPRRLRARRSGRSTSTTTTPRARSQRASPAP